LGASEAVAPLPNFHPTVKAPSPLTGGAEPAPEAPASRPAIAQTSAVPAAEETAPNGRAGGAYLPPAQEKEFGEIPEGRQQESAARYWLKLLLGIAPLLAVAYLVMFVWRRKRPW